MNCPICNVWSTVNETRTKEDRVMRRRECANGHKFKTEERVIPNRTKGGVAVRKTSPKPTTGTKG